jgi:hypothetical protein
MEEEDISHYRSEDEDSCSENESDYEGYDEYYQDYEDGGYFLYSEDYLMSIPGYALFCNDQQIKNRHTLNCMWKKLKKENHSKYHEYIDNYKKQNPTKFYEFRRRYGGGESCLYTKFRK